jgi:hypothetical protein
MRSVENSTLISVSEFLAQLDVTSIKDFPKLLNLTTPVFQSHTTEYLLNLIDKKSQIPKHLYKPLHMYLDTHKFKLSEQTFQKYITEMSSRFQGCTQSQEDLEDSDFEDFDDVIELDGPICMECLFVDALPAKGDLDLELIEDLVETYVFTFQKNAKDADLDAIAKDILESSDWPSDAPIFVSRESVSEYAVIVKALAKKATLIIRGVT